MSSDDLNIRDEAEKAFDEYFVDGLKRNEIPLEFAGEIGRKTLFDAFNRGCGHVTFMLLKKMLESKFDANKRT